MEARTQATLIDLIGEHAVAATLSYESDDPFAITIGFVEDASERVAEYWVAGRELVMAGLLSDVWVGRGEVKVRKVDDQHVLIRQESDGCRADLRFRLGDLSEMVGRTLVQVPLGTEQQDVDLAKLFASVEDGDGAAG